MARSAAKEKRTFSLSREAVGYLHEVARATQKSSSQVIEELIAENKLRAERRRIGHALTSYYDSLTDEEVGQDREWGQFAESQIGEGEDIYRSPESQEAVARRDLVHQAPDRPTRQKS